VAAKVRALTANLQRHIVADKLQGQVLNHRTGALSRSIQHVTDVQGDVATGRVFSSGDVKYAAIHEFGGRTPPHDIYPDKAQALAFMMGGEQIFAKVVHHPGSQMPERSFMRSGLADMADEIVASLREAATVEGARKAMDQ
jgi:phage gpG-like protein